MLHVSIATLKRNIKRKTREDLSYLYLTVPLRATITITRRSYAPMHSCRVGGMCRLHISVTQRRPPFQCNRNVAQHISVTQRLLHFLIATMLRLLDNATHATYESGVTSFSSVYLNLRVILDFRVNVPPYLAYRRSCANAIF